MGKLWGPKGGSGRLARAIGQFVGTDTLGASGNILGGCTHSLIRMEICNLKLASFQLKSSILGIKVYRLA